jgi:metal-responsive CopG/Arc/MetJ family transcriptional regulator
MTHRRIISVSISDELLEQVDQARGEIPRSRFLAIQLEEIMKPEPVASFAASGPARERRE